MNKSLTAKQIKKIISKEFKKIYNCDISEEISVNGSVLDIVITVKNKNNTKISRILGIEIKSDRDSYQRLERQLLDYYKICDRVFIATETKEIPKDLPIGVGIINVKKDSISIERDAKKVEKTTELFTNKAISETLNLPKKQQYKDIKEFFETVNQISKKILSNKIRKKKRAIKLTKEEKVILNKIFSKEKLFL